MGFREFGKSILTRIACHVNRNSFDAIVISKAEKTYIYGQVLVPERVDHQGDIVSEEEIRKACREYMLNLNVGLSHTHLIKSEAIRVTQCFQSPADYIITKDYDFEIASIVIPEGGKLIHKGAWVVEMEVMNKDLKKMIGNEINGFSVGGTAKRKTESNLT